MIRLTSAELKKDAHILEDAIAFTLDCKIEDREQMEELIKVNGFTQLKYGTGRGGRYLCNYVHNDRLYWLTQAVVDDTRRKQIAASKKEILTKDGAPNGWVSDFFKLRGND